MENTTRKLYRSRDDRMLAGVCAGIGEYLGIDPTLARLFFVAMALLGGPGIIFYIILALIIPNGE